MQFFCSCDTFLCGVVDSAMEVLDNHKEHTQREKYLCNSVNSPSYTSTLTVQHLDWNPHYSTPHNVRVFGVGFVYLYRWKSVYITELWTVRDCLYLRLCFGIISTQELSKVEQQYIMNLWYVLMQLLIS